MSDDKDQMPFKSFSSKPVPSETFQPKSFLSFYKVIMYCVYIYIYFFWGGRAGGAQNMTQQMLLSQQHLNKDRFL
jgi:hypothetical protein